MGHAQIDPNDYELDGEYDLSEMTVLSRGRHASTRPAGADIPSSAPDLIALARQVAETAARDPRIVLVYVFGSFAQGDTGPMSDLDLAVLLTRTAPVAVLRAELEDAFSTFSDELPLDLLILNQAPVELAYSVISQGQVLYERAIVERVEYEADVMGRYGDYLPFLRAQRNDIVEGAGNDRRVQRYREALGRTVRTLGAPAAPGGTTSR
jgi:uncharacterized protein